MRPLLRGPSAMTRYSRSVLPGRSADEAPQDTDNLDRMMFGARRGRPTAANDQSEPDFLPPMEEDEADLLAQRSSPDRRNSKAERRAAPVADRRQPVSGRRASEYAPLRDSGKRSAPHDDSKRGPLLLIGAFLIVVVFAVVVWFAYRDGLQSDEVEVTPELSTAGTFKTPPRVVEPAPIVTEPTEVTPDIALDGGPSPVDALNEERPVSLTPPPAQPVESAPAPSKVMAVPPTPLNKPTPAATVPPVQQAAAKPVASAPTKPVVAAPAKPVPAAATPAPTKAAGFTAYGDHVVQIAATQSEAAANAEWAKQLKAYPDLLTGGEKFVQQADVNGKTVYRLRVGSFASKADAAAFCTAFKAKGGNCYPALK